MVNKDENMVEKANEYYDEHIQDKECVQNDEEKNSDNEYNSDIIDRGTKYLY